MKGTIVKIVRDRGFAFLRDLEGNDRFVHADAMLPPHTFEELQIGTDVEFEPIGKGDSSLRAVDVRIETGAGA